MVSRVDTVFINRADVVHEIHRCYDDFESRTCNSCKYWEYNKDNYNGECEHGIDDGTDSFSGRLGTPVTESDFGCNKWEPRDE